MELITKFLTISTLLLITSYLHPISASSSSSSYSSSSSIKFIGKSCNTTTYPSLCLKTLKPLAPKVGTSPLRLCNAALTVAIQSTGNCSSTVTKLLNKKGLSRAEGSAIKECIGDMKDAVYELKRTVNAMGHLRDADREFQWANAKTYASAAITDAETCVDGFLGRKMNPAVKKQIKSCVSQVQKSMSNALSLINHLY